SPVQAIDWALAMPILLVWWAIATLGLYSWAGEKMPWLTIHVALPLVLLGAWALGRVLAAWRRADAEQRSPLVAAAPADAGEAIEWNGNGNGRDAYAAPAAPRPATFGIGGLPTYLLLFGAIAMACLISIANLSKPDGQPQGNIGYVLLGVLFLIGLLTVGAGLLRSPRWAVGALAIGLTLTVGAYTVMSAYRLSFLWPDSAREKMIFVQTSPDLAQVIDRLEKASMRRGGGLDMPVWYDNETVWAWYLRRFTNKQQQSPALNAVPGPEVQAVLMLQENIDANPQNRQNLQGFRIQRYPLRWWFPNEGNSLPEDWLTAPLEENSPLLMRLLRSPLDSRSQAQLWRYLIYRVPPGPLGSTDFVIAVRPELANEIGLGTGGGEQ
ncbi:MAG TPA: TIGR03663 family protein, partial [Roseiflexaceae bacterium]|nr:TIGR03663 family protein [Roseiflexaceae bacterium]